MGKDQIEQASGIGSLDLDLSQGADVDDAGTFAHRPVFLLDTLILIGRTVACVKARPLPLPHVHPDSAEAVMLKVHRRAAHRVVSHPGEHPESHRRRGRPGDGGTHLGDGLTRDPGTEMDGSRLAHSALTSALAQLGDALDQFDVGHTAFDRLRYVVAGNIHTETCNCILRLRRRR